MKSGNVRIAPLGILDKVSTKQLPEFSFIRKRLARRIVESLVEFHPDILEKERAKAIPIILNMLLISLCATMGFISLVIYWLI